MMTSTHSPPRTERSGTIVRGLFLVLSMGAVLPLCSCARDGEHLNLLMIGVDTLRADHLGAYGYQRKTSPSIDRFFASAVVFDDAQATSSWTLPSFASMMTSLHASTHGCWRFRDSLNPSFTTLAEVLRDAGYHTAAIVSHVFLGAKHGLHQGFEDYDESLVRETLKSSHTAITSPDVTERATAFLTQRSIIPGGRPWFLWVHYFDPHSRYITHDGITEKFGDDLADRYDGEIAFTDAYIGQLLSHLDSLEFADDTIVVFVADHGEELHDHGRQGHGRTLHREVVQIPFAIRVPGIAPRRVGATVSGVDLMPTLLDLLSLPMPTTPMAGHSLAPLLEGKPGEDRDALLELEVTRNREVDPDLNAYVSGRWKLIVVKARRSTTGQTESSAVAGRTALFDRERDPDEQQDISAAHPEVVERLRRKLDEARDTALKLASLFDPSEEVYHSPEDLERLRALGYLDDNGAATSSAPESSTQRSESIPLSRQDQ